MGLENIREISGSMVSGVFGGLPIRNFMTELLAPDREKIDHTIPVKLDKYPLVTEVGDFDKKEEFVLPTDAYERMERALLSLPLNRSMRRMSRSLHDATIYAHEYLRNPEVLSLVVDYSFRASEGRGLFDQPDVCEIKRVETQQKMSRTLAHLAAGRLHLFHRREQFEDRPDLQQLFNKIDREQLPEMYRKRKMNVEYWL